MPEQQQERPLYQRNYDCFNNPHVVWALDGGTQNRWKDCMVVAELLGEKALDSWKRIVEVVESFDGTFFGKEGYRLVISNDCELSFYFEYQYKVEHPEVEGCAWKCRMNGGFIFHRNAREWSSHT